MTEHLATAKRCRSLVSARTPPADIHGVEDSTAPAIADPYCRPLKLRLVAPVPIVRAPRGPPQSHAPRYAERPGCHPAL